MGLINGYKVPNLVLFSNCFSVYMLLPLLFFLILFCLPWGIGFSGIPMPYPFDSEIHTATLHFHPKNLWNQDWMGGLWSVDLAGQVGLGSSTDPGSISGRLDDWLQCSHRPLHPLCWQGYGLTCSGHYLRRCGYHKPFSLTRMHAWLCILLLYIDNLTLTTTIWSKLREWKVWKGRSFNPWKTSDLGENLWNWKLIDLQFLLLLGHWDPTMTKKEMINWN